MKRSILGRLKFCGFKDRYSWHLPEHSLKSKLFQLLWEQVCLFFFSCLVECCATERGIFSQCPLTVTILRSFRQRISTWLSLSMPSQSSFSIHRFDQPLLYFQVNSFPYHLNGLSIDSLTSFFPPLVTGLAYFQFSMHTWGQLRELNIALNIDAIVPLYPLSFHQHPLKLSGAAPISTTELLTDLELSDT